MRFSQLNVNLIFITYEKRNKMNFLKKYWWIIAGVVVYMYWDKFKAMLGKTTVAPQPPATEPTDTTTETEN